MVLTSPSQAQERIPPDDRTETAFEGLVAPVADINDWSANSLPNDWQQGALVERLDLGDDIYRVLSSTIWPDFLWADMFTRRASVRMVVEVALDANATAIHRNLHSFGSA